MTTPTLQCPRCGAANDRNYTTCANCGTVRIFDPMAGASPPPPARHAAPPQPRPTPHTPPPTLTAHPTVPPPPTPTRTPSPRPATAPATGPRFARDVTRYLCTAVHTDTKFARKTVEEIVEEPRRAVASSPGVDLGCVLRHALAARRRQVRRDVVLALLLVVVVITLPITFGLTLVLGYLVAWIIVAIESLSVHYGVVAGQLKRENFAPDQAPQPLSAENRRRIEAIERRDRGNVVVFSRYAPFIGYGQSTGTWSFALDTARPEQGKQVVPFTVHDLNDHLAARVGDLKLPGVHVENLLLVNGADLLYGVDDRTRTALLPDEAGPPKEKAAPDLLRELREDGKGRARPYLAIRVTGWSGELAATLFLRCALLSDRKMLFIEGSSSLLAPVRERYRIADQLLGAPTFRQWWTLVSVAGVRAPALLIGAPFSVVAGLFSPLIEHRKQRRQAREIRHRSFNYGASFSMRDAASDQLYYRYFQELDRELYAKTVEHRVLDALVEFMEDHNIDSSDLVQRQTTIYNNGLYAGGDMNLNGSAVGIGGSIAGVFRRGQQVARPVRQGPRRAAPAPPPPAHGAGAAARQPPPHPHHEEGDAMSHNDGGHNAGGHNSGISAGGNLRIDGSAIAVNHSTATTTSAPAETDREAAVAELRAAAHLLLEQLRRDQNHYDDGAELVEAAEHVEAELTREEPRRNTLLRWLGFIAPGVQATAAIAADVAAIQDSVTSLL